MESEQRARRGIDDAPSTDRSWTVSFASPERRLASILTGRRASADLYSPAGARLYERLAAFDDSEQRELLRCLRATDGDILELACGGGRLTLPFLSLGRPVVGLDLSEEMIRILRDRHERIRRPGRAPLVSVVGDMRDFDLARRFGAIVLGTTSILLLDPSDRRQLFEAVKRHLDRRGVFFVTAGISVRSPGEASARIVALDERGTEVALLCDRIAADGRAREVTAIHLGRERGGELDVAVFSSTVFTASADDLDGELAAAGFHRVESIDVEGFAGAGGLRIGGYAL